MKYHYRHFVLLKLIFEKKSSLKKVRYYIFDAYALGLHGTLYYTVVFFQLYLIDTHKTQLL